MSRKVYLHYECPDKEELSLTLKLTLPRKWVAEGHPGQVLELFIDSYNKKKSDAPPLDAAAHHLENADGTALRADDVIGDVLRDREDVKVRAGATQPGRSSTPAPTATPSAAAPAPAAEDANAGKLRCRNYGCNTFYTEAENGDAACAHHVAPPIFHDTRKGWSCCEKRVYDWDEFQAIEGCARGSHSTVDPKVQLAQSPTLAAAAAAAAGGGGGGGAPQLKSIADYNAANPDAATAAGSVAKAAAEAATKCTRRGDGTARCLNRGCGRDFVVADNAPDACRHHVAAPVFHDTGKFWSCCPDRVKYDFDDFVKIEGCATGYHQDGSGEFDNGGGGGGGGGGAAK